MGSNKRKPPQKIKVKIHLCYNGGFRIKQTLPHGPLSMKDPKKNKKAMRPQDASPSLSTHMTITKYEKTKKNSGEGFIPRRKTHFKCVTLTEFFVIIIYPIFKKVNP